MRKQRGITLMGLIVACIVIVFVAIGGLKIAPAYIEYFKVKKAVKAIAQANPAATVVSAMPTATMPTATVRYAVGCRVNGRAHRKAHGKHPRPERSCAKGHNWSPSTI